MCSVGLVSFSLVQIQMYQSLISTVEKKDHLLANQMHVSLQKRSKELLDICSAEMQKKQEIVISLKLLHAQNHMVNFETNTEKVKSHNQSTSSYSQSIFAVCQNRGSTAAASSFLIRLRKSIIHWIK